jgi:hypothetical protein
MDESTLNYAEVKALCAGNPLIAEKMNLDVEVSKLKMLKSEHKSQQYRLEDNILQKYPSDMEREKGRIAGYKEDIALLKENTRYGEGGISPMNVGGKFYTDRKDAGTAIMEACRKIKMLVPEKIGEYRGLNIFASFNNRQGAYQLDFKGILSHTVPLKTDPVRNIQRIDDTLERLPDKLQGSEYKLESIVTQMEAAKKELGKPFAQENILAEKLTRLVELDTLLSLDANKEEKAAEAGEAEKDATSSHSETKLNPTPAKSPEVPNGELKPFVYTPKNGAAKPEPKPETKTTETRTAETKKKGNEAR